MAQIFPPEADTALRVLLITAILAAVGAIGLILVQARSDSAWGVGKPKQQPVPFRHDLHVSGLGLDCRFCHTGVERAAAAGMPSAHICMSCHSHVWTGLTSLEPLRTSLAFNEPIVWKRLHALPDHVFFHHGVHVSSGIACETCHGDVKAMTRTVKAEPQSMGWCLDCHRDVIHQQARTARKNTEGATAVDAEPASTVPAETASRLTDCSACHR